MNFKNENNVISLLNENGVVCGTVEFELDNDAKVISILHTIVKDEFQGKGYAGLLIEEALKFAKENGFKVKPICSYAARYFEKHPENKDLEV